MQLTALCLFHYMSLVAHVLLCYIFYVRAEFVACGLAVFFVCGPLLGGGCVASSRGEAVLRFTGLAAAVHALAAFRGTDPHAKRLGAVTALAVCVEVVPSLVLVIIHLSARQGPAWRVMDSSEGILLYLSFAVDTLHLAAAGTHMTTVAFVGRYVCCGVCPTCGPPDIFEDEEAVAREKEAKDLRATPLGLRVTYLKAVHFRAQHEWKS